MRDLQGKVAFITGGASGLGLALARVFGTAGARVALADVDAGRIAPAVDSLRATGITAVGLPLDVADRSAYADAADEAERQLGPVQLLFNNAGVGVMGKLADALPADWDWQLGVNLGGVVNGLCTFLPRMRQRRLAAHVVSTASAAGLFASVDLGIYVASKMAVVGMMEVLRAELAPEGIGVSVICPHLMRTRIHEHAGSRPERFRTGPADAAADAQAAARIAELTAAGMDPLEVAAETLRAVQDNRLYVIPYPELRGIVRSRWAAIEAALPDTEPDPARVRAEAPTLRFEPYEEALRQSLARGATREAKN
jgi:NAD(P)-dependent dehydrogenase (short-subunit alcohol dehydrogenase family)